MIHEAPGNCTQNAEIVTTRHFVNTVPERRNSYDSTYPQHCLSPPSLDSLQLGQVNSFIKLSGIYPITEHTTIKAELKLGPSVISVGYGLERAVTEHAKFGVFLE